MKVAFSGMILGASMLGANAAPLGDGATVSFVDGSTLTFTAADGGSIVLSEGATANCVAKASLGDAYNDYETDGVAHDAVTKSHYESGSTIAYLCGSGAPIANIDDSKTVHQDGDRVLIHFTGTASECTKSITNPAVVTADDAAGRLYKPTVKATLSYTCKKKQAFSPPGKMGVHLGLQAITDASSIVQNMDMDSEKELSRDNGKDFSAEWTPKFDLGANQPHSEYYEYDDTCANAGQCKGKFTFTADSVSTDHSSDLTTGGAGWKDELVKSSALALASAPTTAASACTGKGWDSSSASPGISEYDACELVQSDVVLGGAKGLLTDFVCPFDGSTKNSVPADVAACVAKGKTKFITNNCGDLDDNSVAREWGYSRPKALQGGYSVNIKFNDESYLSELSDDAATVTDGSKTLGAGENDLIVFDWDLAVTGVPASATDLFVDSTSGFKQSVSVSNGKISLQNVPRSTTSLQLKGYQLLRGDCKRNEVTLDDFTLTVITAVTAGGESFQMKDSNGAQAPCLGKFTFAGHNGAITRIHAPNLDGSQKDITIKFCAAGDSVAKCRSDGVATNQNYGAVIEGACENVRAGHIGALVSFGPGYKQSAIECPGACKSVNLGALELKWDVTFALSITDDTTGQDDNNKLTAPGGSTYSDSTDYDLTESDPYLASNNQCGADGKLYGSIETGCTLPGAVSSLTNAGEFIDKFQACGKTDSESPSVYLIQHVKIAHKYDGSEVHFCNAKLLSAEVQNMQGKATSSIGIAAEVANAASAMSADISFVGYKTCGNGNYKLTAIMDVTEDPSNKVDMTNGIDFTGTPAEFLPSNYSNGVLTFETACTDVCSDPTVFANTYTLDAKLSSAGTGDDQAQLDIDLSIDVDGSPCGESDELEIGSVELTLYAVTDSLASPADCVNGAEVTDVVRATTHDLCAKVSPSGFGSGKLKIIDQKMTRKSPGSDPEDVTMSNGDFFGAAAMSGNSVTKSSVSHDIVAVDAMSTFTLTIVWEQTISGARRLLRTTHVFGAGDHEAKSSIFILPASAQIEDAAGSIEAASEDGASQSGDDAPAEEKDSGLSGGAIAGIIAGGVVVAGGIAYAAMQAQGGRRERMGGAPQYSAVRRSERFSTMNF